MSRGWCPMCTAEVCKVTRGSPAYATCEKGHRFLASGAVAAIPRDAEGPLLHLAEIGVTPDQAATHLRIVYERYGRSEAR